MLELRILGPLEARAGERSLPLGGAKQRALLAILLLHANEVVSTDRLIDELWGESPPETAANTLQVYVSQLRKALEVKDAIATRPPGYALQLPPEQLDLGCFERLLEDGRRALAAGRPADASARLAEALALWRGPALADFAYEAFAQAPIARLEELRLAALEERIDADLALGRHADVVPELEALVAEQPLRERQRGQLMLALYRSGRQAEALEAYQEARGALVEELGIEPSPALQRLERAILNQDPELEAPREAEPLAPTARDERSILVVPREETSLEALLALALPLAASQATRELIAVRLVPPSDDAALARATAALRERREALVAGGVPVRTAAFTSRDPGRDLVRLASQQEVDLLLLDASSALGEESLESGELGAVLADAPCDVGVLVRRQDSPATLSADRPVLVPFGGAEHDWAALELAAWIAGAIGARLELAGVAGDAGEAGRDASWLLANASLVVQQFAGVVTEPRLVEPGAEGLLRAADGAGLLVVGLSERWRQEGLGPVRASLAAGARPPTVFARRGLRPGGLAPRGTLTRFTWSLGGAAP